VKYMLLIYLDEAYEQTSLAEREKVYQEQMQLAQELTSSGQYLAGAPLFPPSSATSVRVRDVRRDA
jgi:hypothetical protein